MSQSVPAFTYAVDLVLAVDSTGSMADIIERVKRGAVSFHDDLARHLREQNKRVDRLRVRVLSFRDFYHDGQYALVDSGFLILPDEQERFASFVMGIQATGGGDDPESGLEALALAIRSNWSWEATKRRHVIVLWTDTGAHPLGGNGSKRPADYPSGMPRSLSELTDLWCNERVIDRYARRLVLYAPDVYPWNELLQWQWMVQKVSKAGEGLKEHEYQTILAFIAGSL